METLYIFACASVTPPAVMVSELSARIYTLQVTQWACLVWISRQPDWPYSVRYPDLRIYCLLFSTIHLQKGVSSYYLKYHLTKRSEVGSHQSPSLAGEIIPISFSKSESKTLPVEVNTLLIVPSYFNRRSCTSLHLPPWSGPYYYAGWPAWGFLTPLLASDRFHLLLRQPLVWFGDTLTEVCPVHCLTASWIFYKGTYISLA